jgi:hypothetical protein
MAKGFRGSVVIDRPIEEVFEFLANGTNDPKFSPRVQEMAKTTDGPVGVGTVYASTVKDAGVKTKREFELTAFEPPRKIRWKEVSKNLVSVPDGGYDLAPANGGTEVTFFNEFEGRGPGRLLAGFAARAAQKDADGFGERMKRAVEGER